MRIRSIRARLTLWYTALLTVTFLILGGAAYGLLSYSLSHEADNALTGVAQALGERAQRDATAVVPSEINELFRRFFGFSPWDPYFQMLDPRGNRDPRQSPPPPGRLLLSEEALRNASRGHPTFETFPGPENYPLRLLTMPILQSGRLVNLIQVGMSLESIVQTRRRFLLIMAGVLPIALLLAATGGWLLAGRALRPVDRITEAAQRIGAKHLSERVEETGAGDELDRLAKTVNEMLTRLDVSFNQMRQFSADASHELQTPLTILKGELEVALRSPRTPEEYRDALTSSLEEVNRIAQLVDGLLLLARAEAGMLRMDQQPVDLADMLGDVARRMKILAEAHSIELRLQIAEPLMVLGDSDRLQRLLLNLADNAIKHTEPGGRITLSLENAGEWVSILVSDSGMGIPEEDLERIFQPFYRTAEARSRVERGTGLGLAIARSIALAHGGSLHVESLPGRGSTFRVSLPVFHEKILISA